MLTLSNGHSFSVACASGALAYGSGYWWEKYGLIPFGIIDPSLFTIITKTITVKPRKGHMRWWPPCVLPLPDGGAVNAVGLSNRGLPWLDKEYCCRRFPVVNKPTIVSVMVENEQEAEYTGSVINTWDNGGVVGVEVNVSCPNIAHQEMTIAEKTVHISNVFLALKAKTKHPVGIKLGYPLDLIRQICDNLDGTASWFDLINTVRWSAMFPGKPSPLARWGYEGGYSGPNLVPLARKALGYVTTMYADDSLRETKLRTPIISGGGIGYERLGCHNFADEAIYRLKNGASAVTIGTLFLTRPQRVNRIARSIIEWEKNRK